MIRSEEIELDGSRPFDESVGNLRAGYPEAAQSHYQGSLGAWTKGRIADDGTFTIQRADYRWSPRSQVGVVVTGRLSAGGYGTRLHATIRPMRSLQVMMWVLAALIAMVGLAVIATTLGTFNTSAAVADVVILVGVAAAVWYFLRRSIVVTGRIAEIVRDDLAQRVGAAAAA
jgi:hypothetical protein